MEIWWKTTPYSTAPRRVEVERSTAKFLVRIVGGRERREAKSTSWETHYPTWQEAHDAMVVRAERKLEAARANVEACQKRLDKVWAARRPEGV